MQHVIDQLTAIVNKYGLLFNNIPAEALATKPAGKWSKKEILGHLVDSAQNNIQRFVRVQYTSRPHITYQQDDWVASQNYQHYNTNDLVLLWALLNKHICIILANIPAEKYSAEINVGKTEDNLVTVQLLAEDYIVHHLHHIKQIVTE